MLSRDEFNDQTFRWVQRIASSPHVAGSLQQDQIKELIVSFLQKNKIDNWVDSFIAKVPHPLNKKYLTTINSPHAQKGTDQLSMKLPMNNVMGFIKGQGRHLTLIGSHYDTKNLPFDFVGANDSGSSSAFLLTMAPILKKAIDLGLLKSNYLFSWFDGEESVLPEWLHGETKHPFAKTDNTYGSRHLAAQIKNGILTLPSKKSFNVGQVIIFDLIGGKNLSLLPDTNSSRALFKQFKQSADELFKLKVIGFNPFSERTTITVEDDHLPFAREGLTVIDIIDFVNLEHWHRPTDRIEQIDKENFFVLAIVLLETLKKLESKLQF